MMRRNLASAKQTWTMLKEFQLSLMYGPNSYYNSRVLWDIPVRRYTIPAGIPGSGAGKGGGGGGSVRESGGGLGKYGAAQEEGYFHHKQREQLQKIKKQMQEGNPDLTQKKEK